MRDMDIVERLRAWAEVREEDIEPHLPMGATVMGSRFLREAADEIERLRERLTAAEAVIAEHDRARATVSPPPCACPAHIAWRQRSGR